MIYTIHVNNNSGKNYQYTSDSAVLGTVPPTLGEPSFGIGFDSYPTQDLTKVDILRFHIVF